MGLEEHEARTCPQIDLLALDDALAKLSRLDPRMAQLVELRYFAGLRVTDAADALGVSPATAAREWELARVWLHSQLSEDGPRDA